MRLDSQIITFLKQQILAVMPDAKVYLFGSRTNDDALGGDIDILILTEKPINKRIFRPIRVEFFKQFGWQKLDLVNYTYNDTSVFKQLIQTTAIQL